jgi:hypothetical protein
MGKIVTIALGLTLLAALSAPVLAVEKCRTPPPSWWNAPRVSQVYEGGSRASYANSGATSHTFSAQRRNPAPSFFAAPRYRDPFRRW